MLNNHAELLSTLDVGALKFAENGNEHSYTCNFGLLEVQENKVSVLTESSELVSEIDVSRAQNAHDRAQKRLKSKNSGSFSLSISIQHAL